MYPCECVLLCVCLGLCMCVYESVCVCIHMDVSVCVILSSYGRGALLRTPLLMSSAMLLSHSCRSRVCVTGRPRVWSCVCVCVCVCEREWSAETETGNLVRCPLVCRDRDRDR